MKISKVYHTKTGVGKKNINEGDSEITGILYNDPQNTDKDAKISGLQSYINNKLNSKAKGLYAVLNSVIQFELDDKIKDKEESNQKQNNQNQEHPAYTILKKFNVLMKSVYLKADEDNATIKIVEEQIEWLSYLPNRVQYINKNGKDVYWKYFKIELEEEECNQIVEQLVIHNLRRSLRKNIHIVLENGKVKEINTLEVVKKLMIAFCNVNNKKKFQEKFNNISKIELEEFLKILNEDYTKQKQIIHIVKSIENQTVKVQCANKENKVLLQLASAGHKGKEGYEGKEHIFEFLKEYASATVQQRKEKLIHFRKLIILYYRGIEKYREAESSDISAWDFGSFKADENECFCVEAKTLIENKQEMFEKTERRKQNEQIQQVIKKEIVQRYRTIKENVKLTGADVFWLEFIEEQARKILIGKKNLVILYKLSTKYLCDSTWKAWISYIGMKYIDMGKAVYHFVMPDIGSLSKSINDKTTKQCIEIGEVLPEYVNGITSFDYERIKAQESLERDISLYVTFALKAFSQAICSEDVLRELGTDKKSNEDVLQMSKEYLQQVIYKDSKRRILQFFGGQSAWETDDMEYKKLSVTSMGKIKQEELSGIELTEVMKMEIGKVAGLELAETMKKQLSLIRNSSFHYTSVLELDGRSIDAIAEKLFLKEYGEIGEKYREKYYTNNVPMFYSVNDINELMNKLYSAPKNIPAQVPAFNKIIKKTDLFQVIQELLYNQDKSEKGKVNKRDLQKDCVNFRSDISKMGEADRQKFNAAFLFILKEIYYYDFLRNAQSKMIFMHALDKMLKEAYAKSEKKHQYATKNIIERIKSMGENVSLGEICQRIITDYNMQNNDKMVKSSGDAKIKKEEQSYKHFKLLLYEGLRNAFISYLKKEMCLEKENIKSVKKESNIYAFLLNPVLREKPEEKEFCKSWKTGAFSSIKKTIKEEPVFLAWYIIVHFLTQRQLNHLMGSIKNYIQYVTDINKRAKNTQNRVSQDTKIAIKRYKKLIPVLECAMFFCEQITNHVTDYFDEGDEKRERCAKESYAECLSDFVDFVSDDVLQNNEELFQENPYANALNEFCERPVKQGSPNGKIGIYYDAINPVINRNVVKAMMYGNLKILSECMVPVTENEILDLYEKQQGLKKVFKEGRCENKEEQELLKEFQNLKNRVELLDVLIYSEIMNELLAQLISWAYLRERDMMYLQLGFHYIELFYSDKIKKDSVQRKLECKELNITDGAILYQIVAMYTHQLPVIIFDKEKKPCFSKKQDRGTGKSVQNFAFNYSNIHVYYAGLCFFENIAEHDAITAFRNYIDHFKYYVKRDRSIMDLYSEVYDRFFTYDPKLKKSVTFIFKNILMKYFVKADITMAISKEQRKKVYSIKKDGELKTIEKKAAKISLKDKKGLQTDYFNYKIGDQNKKIKQVEIAARTHIFLKQLRNILEYEK